MNEIVFLITGVIAWRLHTSFNHLSTVPKEIPWVGKTGTLVPYIWTQIKAIWKTPSTISEAYHKYSKHGSICAIPLPFSRPEILLPRSLIRWMIGQDDGLLSPTPVQYEVVGVKYAFVNPSVHGDFAVYNVLRANMNKQLPKMIPTIMKELALRIDETFGLDDRWREVQSHDLVRQVICRVAARIILGAPLCHDEKLFDSISSFTTCVVPSAMLLRLFPPFMHPFLSYITHFFNRLYKRRTLKVLGPYIEQQLEALGKEFDLGAKNPHHPRDDVLTWLIADALRRNEPREGLVDRIACRVFVAVFASMETTTMTISHALFDLCASDDPSVRVWDRLAEEGTGLFARPLDLSSVNGLARADSALKETLRLRTSIKALATQVMASDGLVLPKGYPDVRLPRGARLGVAAWGIHRDRTIYGPDADEYDAFRFSRPDEEAKEKAEKNEEKAAINGDCCCSSSTTGDSSGGKVNLMVSATENYLPFGMGRHSCPGRYFAAVELKLFLAYLAVHYDLKLADSGRPGFVSIGHFPIPPLKGRLAIRRKDSVFKTTFV